MSVIYYLLDNEEEMIATGASDSIQLELSKKEFDSFKNEIVCGSNEAGEMVTDTLIEIVNKYKTIYYDNARRNNMLARAYDEKSPLVAARFRKRAKELMRQTLFAVS